MPRRIVENGFAILRWRSGRTESKGVVAKAEDKSVEAVVAERLHLHFNQGT